MPSTTARSGRKSSSKSQKPLLMSQSDACRSKPCLPLNREKMGSDLLIETARNPDCPKVQRSFSSVRGERLVLITVMCLRSCDVSPPGGGREHGGEPRSSSEGLRLQELHPPGRGAFTLPRRLPAQAVGSDPSVLCCSGILPGVRCGRRPSPGNQFRPFEHQTNVHVIQKHAVSTSRLEPEAHDRESAEMGMKLSHVLCVQH